MSDNFVAALADLRDTLIAGDSVEDALAACAEEHDVSPVALRNRAQRAFGDLDTYGKRTIALRVPTADTQRRMDLSEKRAAVYAMGRVLRGGEDEVKLRRLVEEVNGLGGRMYVR